MRSLLWAIFAAVAGYLLAGWLVPRALPVHQDAAVPPEQAALHPRPVANSSEAEPARQSSSPRTDLARALSGMNPIAAAPRALAWIESATAEDFAALARDPAKFPRPIFNAFQHEFRDAFYEAFFERWFSVDPDAMTAIRAVHASLKKTDRYDADELLKGAARVRPELLLQEIDAEPRDYLAGYQTEAFRVLAARDPRKARAFADGLPEKLKKGADAAIIMGIAEHDPLSALGLARNLDQKMSASVLSAIVSAAERIGPGVLRQVFAADAGLLDRSPDLQRLLLRYPDLAEQVQPVPGAKPAELYLHPSDELLHQADLLSPEERKKALDRTHDMPPAISATVAAALASAWAREDPQSAAAWALGRANLSAPSDPANQAAHLVFLRWIHSDRSAALAWFRGLPPSPLRDAIGTNASTFIAAGGEMGAAIELCRPTGTKADQKATAHLLQIYAEQDPAAAAAWMAKLPDAAVSAESVSALLYKWYPQSPAAVAEWLETLPPGLRRDEALKGFVTKAARESPDAAAAWAETIDEPRLRQDAAASVFFALNREDPARAREWLRGLSGVDETWRARFLRRIR